MKRVLVAPLNWGLGHATRCIPIIEYLMELGHEVHLASDGRASDLLKHEFATLDHHTLPGYGIQHPANPSVRHWMRSMPSIYRAIEAEKAVTKDLVFHLDFDAIISDNRYGVHHSEVPSAIVTHQLRLAYPGLWRASGLVLQHFISRFSACWIPDQAPPKHLTGRLTEAQLPIPKRFIGMLSRFEAKVIPIQYSAVAVISGPEPSRSRFEQMVFDQMQDLPGKKLLIQGIPDEEHNRRSLGAIDIVKFAGRRELQRWMAQAHVVIARSGYTTIMDLLSLHKAALLVPTPGQPEQAYLSTRLERYRQFIVQQEPQLDLKSAYHRLTSEEVYKNEVNSSAWKSVVNQFVNG